MDQAKDLREDMSDNVPPTKTYRWPIVTLCFRLFKGPGETYICHIHKAYIKVPKIKKGIFWVWYNTVLIISGNYIRCRTSHQQQHFFYGPIDVLFVPASWCASLIPLIVSKIEWTSSPGSKEKDEQTLRSMWMEKKTSPIPSMYGIHPWDERYIYLHNLVDSYGKRR